MHVSTRPQHVPPASPQHVPPHVPSTVSTPHVPSTVPPHVPARPHPAHPQHVPSCPLKSAPYCVSLHVLVSYTRARARAPSRIHTPAPIRMSDAAPAPVLQQCSPTGGASAPPVLPDDTDAAPIRMSDFSRASAPPVLPALPVPRPYSHPRPPAPLRPPRESRPPDHVPPITFPDHVPSRDCPP